MKLPALSGFDPKAFEKYFKNTGWLFMGRIGSLLIKMLVGFLVANYLGAEQNGNIQYAYSFVFLFLCIASLGIDSLLVRELVSRPSEGPSLLGTAFIMKVIGGSLMIPLCIISYWLFDSSQTPSLFILILSFSGLFQSFTVIDSYFQAKVRSRYITIASIGGGSLVALFKAALVYYHYPLHWFVWATLADTAILAPAYILVYYSQKQSIRFWSFDTETAKELLIKSWPLIFSAILVSIYMKIDQVMIGTILGQKALGIYSTVVQLSEGFYFIPIVIVTSLFPAIISFRNTDPERYKIRLQNLYDLMVILSLAIAIGMSLCSEWIYSMVYKAEYQSGAAVLIVHVWAGIFVFLGSASGQYLIAEGYTGISLIRTSAGAVVNIVLNLILLPKMGIIGAAWATLFAYFIATFFLFFIPKTRAQALLMFKSLSLFSILQKVVKP